MEAARQNLKFDGDRKIGVIATIVLTLISVIGISCSSSDPDGNGIAAPTEREHVYSKNNLKQFGIALFNYHDVNRTFPPGGVYQMPAQKPMHSWGAFLLPYVEQRNIFGQIDFNKTWNDPVNQPMMQQTVPVYQQLNIQQKTDAQGYGLIHYSANKYLLYENSSMRIRDISDGVSNTFLLGEINAGFMPWGQPGNFRDITNGVGGGTQGFGSENPDGVLLLLADGTVKLLNPRVDPKVLKAIATPDGGELIE